MHLKRLWVMGAIMLLAACVARPDTPPTVVDAKLSTAQLDPGESFNLSFTLKTEEFDRVKRVYLRGLPKNSVLAGTTTELAVPESPITNYDETIILQKPAADGLYEVVLVVDYNSVSFTAPAGILEVNDIPSQITYSQFVPGSHVASDCSTPTRLLELQYTVFDENGAADMVSPVMTADASGHESLVFFPHWEAVPWQDESKGIVLKRPSDENSQEEFVVDDVRINCEMPSKSLYDFKIKGQNVAKPKGSSVAVESASFKYYVE
jgi:hypothetical protein